MNGLGGSPYPRVTITHDTRYIHIMNKTDRFFDEREWDWRTADLNTRAMYEDYLVELSIFLNESTHKKHLCTSVECVDPLLMYTPSKSVTVYISTLERGGIDYTHTIEEKVFDTLIEAIVYASNITKQYVGELIAEYRKLEYAKGVLRDMGTSRYIDFMLTKEQIL